MPTEARKSWCERCGNPARPSDDASHVFCEACLALASTGARSSSELLFTARKEAANEETLVVGRSQGERISIPITGSIAMPVPTVIPPRRLGRFAIAVGSYAALATSVALFAGAFALATDARQREQRILSFAEGAIVVEETVRPEAPAPHIPAAVIAPSMPSTVVEPAIAPEPVPPARRPRAARTVEPVVAPAIPIEEAPLEHVLARPTLPTRSEVQSALARLQSRVEQCSDGAHGTARARITFLSSGRVTSAVIDESSAPPAVRSCIARVVRDAELPAFSQERFTVAFPYRF